MIRTPASSASWVSTARLAARRTFSNSRFRASSRDKSLAGSHSRAMGARGGFLVYYLECLVGGSLHTPRIYFLVCSPTPFCFANVEQIHDEAERIAKANEVGGKRSVGSRTARS